MFFDYKLFAGNFHFKRLLLLTQYFYCLNGYLLTTGQIYGFSGALPNVCTLMYINGKTPALFPGLLCLLSYTVFVSPIWATKIMLRSTGVAVFRSPFHFLYCQTYRGGLSIYRKFRVEISTRSAYLFGASIIWGASGRNIRDCPGTSICLFHSAGSYVCLKISGLHG